MVKIIKQEKNGNLITVEAEAEADAVNKGIQKAFVDLSKNARIPGFRSGKAPRKVFEQFYGRDYLFDRAASYIIDAVYPDIIKGGDIDPIDHPKNIDIKPVEEAKPLLFSFSVEVKPEVKLGKYKGVKVDIVKPVVGEAQIQEQIDRIADQLSDYKPVEEVRGLQNGDLATYHVRALIEGETYQAWTREPGGGRVGTPWIDPQFDEKILGIKVNEERNFVIHFSKDHPHEAVQDKDVSFFVKLGAIHQQIRPEIDDELAKKNGRFQTLAELKADIQKHLQMHTDQDFDRDKRQKLFDAVLERCEVMLPEVLVKRELERIKRNFEQELGRQKIDLAGYARLMKKTEDDVVAEMKPAAEQRVKLELVLEAVAKAEKIEVGEADFDAEIKRQAENSQKPEDAIRRVFTAEYKQFLQSYLLEEKTIQWLLEQAKIA